MPYCTNCGEEVTPDQRFCSYCGEALDDRGARQRRGTEPPQREPADHADRDQHSPDPAPRQQQPRESPAEQPRPHERLDEPAGTEPGTIETYTGSLRAVFRQPLPLFGLFVAWFVVSALVLLGPLAGTLAGILAAGVGLGAAGILYVQTDAQERETTISLASAFAQVAGTALALVGVWFVYVVGVSIGLALFVFPGLYLGGRLLLAFPACVLDGTGPVQSLKRSWRLTSSVSLQPIGFLVLAVLTMVVLTFVLSIPQAIVFSLFGVELAEFETLDAAIELLDDPTFVLINAFFQAIVLAIPLGAVQIAATRLYLRQRGDGEPRQD